jgi:putative flippase GtrA
VLFNLLVFAGLGIAVANVINYAVSATTIFLLHKYYTYRAREGFLRHLILFSLNTAVYYCVDTTLLIIFIRQLGISPWISKAASILVLTPVNFLSQKFIIFRAKTGRAADGAVAK